VFWTIFGAKFILFFVPRRHALHKRRDLRDFHIFPSTENCGDLRRTARPAGARESADSPGPMSHL
jgi:hypothetical protein